MTDLSQISNCQSSCGAPLPPPPPAPVSLITPVSNTSKPDMGELFSNLNKGEQITSGLKKVEKSQMTHKNPDLRASGVVKAESTKSLGQSGSVNQFQAGSKSLSKSQLLPVLELDGNKWRIENHDGNQNIVIEQTNLKQVVYIYNCRQCLIQVKGKINAVTMDSCSKTALLVENVVSSIDVVQCVSGQLQIVGSSPTIMMDKVDGFQIYYSRNCVKETQLLTAKCSEINILMPGQTDADDYIEKAVPEQFKTIINDSGDMITQSVTHSG